MERQLVADYEAGVDRLVAALTPERLPLAVKIAEIPQQIRGFGHVKAASVGPAKAEEARLWKACEQAEELVEA
jgi:indolepyruvate ferredoxin oxidoreductase